MIQLIRKSPNEYSSQVLKIFRVRNNESEKHIYDTRISLNQLSVFLLT